MKTIRPVTCFPLVALLFLGACAAPPVPRVGADRDAHGCIGSAGYAWCEREAACVRPWELAAEKSFVAGAEGFADYCRGPAR